MGIQTLRKSNSMFQTTVRGKSKIKSKMDWDPILAHSQICKQPAIENDTQHQTIENEDGSI